MKSSTDNIWKILGSQFIAEHNKKRKEQNLPPAIGLKGKPLSVKDLLTAYKLFHETKPNVFDCNEEGINWRRDDAFKEAFGADAVTMDVMADNFCTYIHSLL